MFLTKFNIIVKSFAQNSDQNRDIIDNTTAINALNIRLGSTGDFGIFKDTTATTLAGLANQVDATFSGNFTDLTATSTKRTSTLNGIDKSTEIPNTNWVQDYFSIIQSDITPGPGITSDLGTLTQAFRDLHITRSIIPAGLPTKTDITNDNYSVIRKQVFSYYKSSLHIVGNLQKRTKRSFENNPLFMLSSNQEICIN